MPMQCRHDEQMPPLPYLLRPFHVHLSYLTITIDHGKHFREFSGQIMSSDKKPWQNSVALLKGEKTSKEMDYRSSMSRFLGGRPAIDRGDFSYDMPIIKPFH